MKIWPFGNGKLETRAADSYYRHVLIAALVSRAQGRRLSSTDVQLLHLKLARVTIGKRLPAEAEVTGPDSLTQALTPSIMEMIGRSLIRTGEVVFLIDTRGGAGSG